jgi:hypothetical protein
MISRIGQATGNDNGIPPWTSIIQKPNDYFDVDQLPEGFTLLDPSKMKDPQVQEVLNFWYKRQEDGEGGIGFQFQAQSSDQPRKRKRGASATPSTSDRTNRKKQKGKAKEVLTWKDYIQPDSRRRKRRSGTVSLESSHEHFDFSRIDEMSSDSDMAQNDNKKPGQSSSAIPVAGKKLGKEGGHGEFLYYMFLFII